MASPTVPLSLGRTGPASLRAGVRPRLALALAVLALAALAATTLTRTGGAAPLVGEPAPPFSLAAVRATEPPAALPAGRPTVLNFFAAWCAPCREELPVLAQAHRRAGGAVAFVGVDVNDSRRAAAELLDGTGVTYPAGYDADASIAGRYRLQGMPTTVFIGADGRVDGVVTGPLDAADLDRRIGRIRDLGVGAK